MYICSLGFRVQNNLTKFKQNTRGIVNKLERQTINGDYIFSLVFVYQTIYCSLYLHWERPPGRYDKKWKSVLFCLPELWFFFPFAVNHMKLWKSLCQIAEAGSSLSDSKADHLAFVCTNPLTTLRYLKASIIYHKRHKDQNACSACDQKHLWELSWQATSQPIGPSRFGKLFCSPKLHCFHLGLMQEDWLSLPPNG